VARLGKGKRAVFELRGTALAVSFSARADGDKWAGRGGPALPFFRLLPQIGFARALRRVHANGCLNHSDHIPGHDRAVM